MTVLPPREAYRLWAPNYAAETAISALDDEVTARLSPPSAGLRMLDAGCGIGRRLPREAALAIGVDLSPDMLARAPAREQGGVLAAADVRALPFANGSFDLVWCRLVLGHLDSLAQAYDELGRVTCGHLLVTDFHPDAAQAGGRRTFRDADGTVHEVEHHIYRPADHAAAARAAGLTLMGMENGTIGPSVRPYFEKAGRPHIYLRDCGLAVVAGYLFRKEGRCAS